MRITGGSLRPLGILVAVLGFMLAMSPQAFAADASSNWYEASGPVPPSIVQAGAIDSVGDVDWYYFYNDVPSGVTAGAVKIGINRATGNGDNSSLTLYRWDGGKLVSVRTMSTYSSSPIDAALKAGLCYIRISGYNTSVSAGSYDFTVAGTWVAGKRPYFSAVAGNSSTLRRLRTYSFSGYVQPVADVALRVYRYDAGRKKYAPYGTVSATLSSGGVPRRFSAPWKPTSAGKYRLHWQTKGPAGMSMETSGYRYVQVK